MSFLSEDAKESMDLVKDGKQEKQTGSMMVRSKLSPKADRHEQVVVKWAR